MLNYVFFDEGQSRIPARYILFKDRAETQSFSFDRIAGAMEKHRHLLNIIGKRLRANTQTSIRVVGCNADSLEEKGRVDISRERASAVKGYLEAVWGIAPSRITLEARGLPSVPSPSRHEEGRAENRRVEILSDSPEILDSIASTYVEYVSPSKELKVIPQMAAGYGIERWRVAINGEDGTSLTSLSGAGDPPDHLTLNLKELGLKKIAAQKAIVADVELIDRKGNIYKHSSTSRCNVNFMATESRKAQKIGYRVQESYALILFDFGSDKISGRNQVISERIVGRFNSLPRAEVKIIGHTDTTGPEEVNLALSERRARAVHSQLKKIGMKPAEGITVTGVGPYDPLYDNALPEGRALNRTVSIYIEYAAVD
jgi:outer membrane protein OmpA-like peptidoglycan-associated protein